MYDIRYKPYADGKQGKPNVAKISGKVTPEESKELQEINDAHLKEFFEENRRLFEFLKRKIQSGNIREDSKVILSYDEKNDSISARLDEEKDFDNSPNMVLYSDGGIHINTELIRDGYSGSIDILNGISDGDTPYVSLEYGSGNGQEDFFQHGFEGISPDCIEKSFQHAKEQAKQMGRVDVSNAYGRVLDLYGNVINLYKRNTYDAFKKLFPTMDKVLENDMCEAYRDLKNGIIIYYEPGIKTISILFDRGVLREQLDGTEECVEIEATGAIHIKTDDDDQKLSKEAGRGEILLPHSRDVMEGRANTEITLHGLKNEGENIKLIEFEKTTPPYKEGEDTITACFESAKKQAMQKGLNEICDDYRRAKELYNIAQELIKTAQEIDMSEDLIKTNARLKEEAEQEQAVVQG